MAEINLHLFGKPEWEMDLDEASAEDFKNLGESLKERMFRVSEIVILLEKGGWERSSGLYDITFYKKIKLEEAKKELQELNIKEDEINLDDMADEESDEESDEDFEDSEQNEENFAETKWVKKKQ